MRVDATGALASALQGIRSNFDRLDRAASRIAAEAPTGDLEGALVAMINAEHGVAANVKVAQTADRTLGMLLDLLA